MADHAEHSEDNFTTRLLQSAGFHNRAPAAQKSQALAALLKVAAERSAFLSEKLEHDPREFLLQALPADASQRLLKIAELKGLLEERRTVTGTLRVLVAYATNGTTWTEYALENSQDPKERLRLYFATNPPPLPSGTVVKANGVALGSKMALAQGSGESLTTVTAAAPVAGGGNLSTLVLMFNFTNDTSMPWTTAAVEYEMFTGPRSVNAYYQETSYGADSYSGKALIVGTIDTANSDGAYWRWADLADQKATALGENLSSYSRKIYLFPRADSFGAAGGRGELPGTRSWINGSLNAGLFAHELGHNRGVHHANSINCDTLAINDYSLCTIYEYGDTYDTMGYWNLFAWNGPHKALIGWVPSTRVQSVTADGTFTIAPLETNSTAIQELKIHKADTNEDYYISYRQPVGVFDAALPAGITRGASVHIGSIVTEQTKFVDTTPGDGDFSNAALADGTQFLDPINGVTVKQLSHNSNGATLAVTFGGPVCYKVAPLVQVQPWSQTAKYAGQTLTYTVSVTNKDTPACANTTFNLSATLPTGWTSSFSPTSLQLAPGAVGSATWTVTSATNASDGSYEIAAKTIDIADSNHASSKNATYFIYTYPPMSPSNLSATPASSTQINLTWTDNADNEAGFNVYRKTMVNIGGFDYAVEYLPASLLYKLTERGNNTYYFSSTYYYFSSVAPLQYPALSGPAGPSTAVYEVKYDGTKYTFSKYPPTLPTEIYVFKPTTGDFSKIVPLGPNSTGYSDTDLLPNTSRCYQVFAYNNAGESGTSNISCATTPLINPPPAAPSNLVATPVSSTQIKLTWADNASNEEGFKIYRRRSDITTFTLVKTLTTPDLKTYTDSGLLSNRTYYYKVTAYNSGGESADSNIPYATTLKTKPAAPTSLTATAVSSSQIKLTWADNATNEEGFKVYRRRSDITTFTLVKTLATPDLKTYIDTGLYSKRTYYYKVRAYNNGGESPDSNIPYATTF